MDKATKLPRSIGLTSVVVFGTGTAVGVSIFSVLGPAASLAGSGLLLAMALAGIPMLFFAFSYAWLASAVPVTGASYEWPRRFIHPSAGFMVAWLRILTNIGAITVLGTVLVNYLNSVMALPLKPVMALLFTVMFALNLFGVAVAARAQSLLVGLLVVMIVIYAGTGAASGSIGNIGPLMASGWAGVFAAVPLMISLYLGIETAVEVGDEVRRPERNIPLGIGLAIALTALLYVVVAAVSLSLVGPAGLAASDAPLFDAGRLAMGDWAVPVILGTASISILTTINSLVVVFSRSLFAMGRSQAFPEALGRVHHRFGTPHVAIIVAYLLVMSGLFLPSNITFLLLAVNIPTMLKYLMCSLSATQVMRRFPSIAARARLRSPSASIYAAGYGGVLLALAVVILGFQADWRPYALVLGWAVAGGLVWAAYSRHHVKEASA